MDIKELRSQIDGIDSQLVKLFTERMEVSARIADYKKENGMPIFIPGREREKLQSVADIAAIRASATTPFLLCTATSPNPLN